MMARTLVNLNVAGRIALMFSGDPPSAGFTQAAAMERGAISLTLPMIWVAPVNEEMDAAPDLAKKNTISPASVVRGVVPFVVSGKVVDPTCLLKP